MTEVEFILTREAITQSVIAMGDLQANHIAIYLTLIFAYISFAYLAGKQLSKSLLYLLSVMFVCAAGFQVFNIVSLAEGSTVKISQLKALITTMDIPATSQTIWDNVILWVGGIVGALAFMWSVRKEEDS